MGGYVCFPGGLMASLLGKPLVLVNADASLLLSNRALLPVADRVAFGFDGAAAKASKRAVVTGNPVRAEIEALPDAGRALRRPQRAAALLVVGGSLGARVLNETLPQALALLDAAAAAAASPTRPAPLQLRRGAARPTPRAGVDGRGAALHRRHGRAPGDLRPDGLPRRRGHGERAVRRPASPACWCR